MPSFGGGAEPDTDIASQSAAASYSIHERVKATKTRTRGRALPHTGFVMRPRSRRRDEAWSTFLMGMTHIRVFMMWNYAPVNPPTDASRRVHQDEGVEGASSWCARRFCFLRLFCFFFRSLSHLDCTTLGASAREVDLVLEGAHAFLISHSKRWLICRRAISRFCARLRVA